MEMDGNGVVHRRQSLDLEGKMQPSDLKNEEEGMLAGSAGMRRMLLSSVERRCSAMEKKRLLPIWRLSWLQSYSTNLDLKIGACYCDTSWEDFWLPRRRVAVVGDGEDENGEYVTSAHAAIKSLNLLPWPLDLEGDRGIGFSILHASF
ncbi:hypothetical protein ACLOJK_029848 [Asimina triloba]